MSHTLINRPADVDVRRAIHCKILPETHAALRILLIQKGLSFQEFFEEMAQRAIVQDPAVERIVDELVTMKKERYYRKLSATDAESIFDIIEHESPLK